MTEITESTPAAPADEETGDDGSRLALDERLEGLPTRARRQLRDARQALDRRDAASAEAALARAQASAAAHPEFLRLLGVTRLMQKRAAEAVALLERASEMTSSDPLILTNLGSALRSAGDTERALATLRSACKLAPDLAAGWHNLGQALSADSKAREACEAYARAIRSDPDHVNARIGHGDALKTLGEMSAAAAEYRNVLARDPGNVRAWARIANLKTIRFDAEELARLRALTESSALGAEDRATAGFALSKALDDEGRYDEAFSVLAAANAVKRRLVEWNAAAFHRHAQAIAAAFADPVRSSAASDFGREAIFIVSLPRSGSSLTEQILASHPEVEGAGELSDLGKVIDDESRRRGRAFPAWVGEAKPGDWRRLGEDYLARTERWRHSASRFTDKALANWRYVGAIMAMLPGARIVNVRRDPLETCFACFRQLFGKGHGYAYDFAEIAAYWQDYDRLMRFWHARYPHRLFDLVYEDLIADPELQIRRLLEFCALEFDPACLRFHETERSVRTPSTGQVRQPLMSDTARARRYGDLLAPLRLALGAAPRS